MTSTFTDTKCDIALAGSYQASSSPQCNFALAEFTSSGTLNTSFNSTGEVTTAFDSGKDVAESVVFDSSGNILAAGCAGTGGDSLGVVRYTSSGAVDTAFGTAGQTVVDLGDYGGPGRTGRIGIISSG